MINIDLTKSFEDIMTDINSKDNLIINKKIIEWMGNKYMILNGLSKQLDINKIDYKYIKKTDEDYIIINVKDFKKYLMTLDTDIGNKTREYYVNMY